MNNRNSVISACQLITAVCLTSICGGNDKSHPRGKLQKSKKENFTCLNLLKKPICDLHRHSQFYIRVPFNKTLCNLTFTSVGM
jgi:hypothetical protein